MDGITDLLLDAKGHPLTIHVRDPLRSAQQRFMDTLGVRVVTVSAIAGVAHCTIGDCDWSHEGTSVECAEAGEAHRAAEHSWIRSDRYVTFIAGAPAVSAVDALAALDAGVPQRTLYPAEIETRYCATPNCDREAGVRSFYCDICRADRDRRRAAELAQLETPEPAPEPAPTEEEEPIVATAIWTRELIIEAIHAHRREHGSLPTSGEWATGSDDHPSSGQITRVFGSWASGIEAAGYERPVRGGNRTSPAKGSGIRSAEEDANRPADPPESEEKINWYIAWLDALPIDRIAMRLERDILEKEIKQHQQRILTLDRLLAILDEELVAE